MLSGTEEPECRQRQLTIRLGNVGAVDGGDPTAPTATVVPAAADDAPRREATKALARATIHPTVTGAATQTSDGLFGAIDWVNSIAVN